MQLFLAILLFVTVGTSAAMLLLYGLRRVFKATTMAVPVATFLSVVATAWALALGFAAADVWTLRAEADKAAFAERSSVMRMIGMAEADALDIPELREAIVEYVDLVTRVEWGADLNSTPYVAVDETLQAVRLTIIDLARSEAPPTLVSKAVIDFDELQDARNKRLALGGNSISQYKWYLVLFLTFLSMVSIAAVHAERPPAARNALAVFAVAAVVSLWILALHAMPYAGAARIGFEEIQFPITRS